MNRYIRERFIAEACHVGIDDLDELNDRFEAWAESVANRRVHAETNQAPIARGRPGAHLVATTLLDELAKHGVIASLVRIDIDDLPGKVR